MKFFKLLFAFAFSTGLILSGYYFIWNFIANKRIVEITHILDNINNLDINYKNATIYGYPNNINISLENLILEGTNDNSKLNYRLGDVLFKIYPFVLEQQAEIHVPSSHAFSVESNGEIIQFKLQSSDIDISFLDNRFNLNFKDFKLFDVEANELLVSADKVYYTGYINQPNLFKANATNLSFKGQTIDSVLLDLEVVNMDMVDFYSSVLNLLVLEESAYNQNFNDLLTRIKDKNTKLNIKNMKFVNEDVWYEFAGLLSLDPRTRIEGNVEVVSNDVDIVQSILKFITANENTDITQIDLIKRLMSNNGNDLVRISGEIKKGFLKIFNEKVSRARSIKK